MWWILRTMSNRTDRLAAEQIESEPTYTVRQQQILRYELFVAEAHRTGAWIGMWIGSLTLLLTLAFEYLRKWLIDEVDMPAFPIVVFLVAVVPVVMLTIQFATRAKLPKLPAKEISVLLEVPPKAKEPVEALALSTS